MVAAFKADHLSFDNWGSGRLIIDRPAEPRQPRDRTRGAYAEIYLKSVKAHGQSIE
jgi:hypothetical protein